MRSLLPFLAAVLVAGCSTGGDEPSYASVPLAATRLAGAYTLVDYLFEYGDGARLDPTILKLTGKLYLSPDSGYLEGIRVGEDSTPTRGRVLAVLVRDGDPDQGRLTLDLAQADSSAPGESAYAFRHDTLVLVTEVPKARDAAHKGFRETAYWTRDPGPAAP